MHTRHREHRYLVVCAPDFGEDNLLALQLRRSQKISEQARIVSSIHNADWVLRAIKYGVPHVRGIYVVRLDPDGDEASECLDFDVNSETQKIRTGRILRGGLDED